MFLEGCLLSALVWVFDCNIVVLLFRFGVIILLEVVSDLVLRLEVVWVGSWLVVVGSWVFLFWGLVLYRFLPAPFVLGACLCGVFDWYCGFVYVWWLVYCWWFRFGKCAGCRCLWVGLLVRCLVGCWLLWVVCCTLFCVFAFVCCASLVVASVWMYLVVCVR